MTSQKNVYTLYIYIYICIETYINDYFVPMLGSVLCQACAWRMQGFTRREIHLLHGGFKTNHSSISTFSILIFPSSQSYSMKHHHFLGYIIYGYTIWL